MLIKYRKASRNVIAIVILFTVFSPVTSFESVSIHSASQKLRQRVK